MSNPSLVVVLVEDQRQKQFIYRFLAKAGVRPRQIQIELSPSGRGSAEKWVCDNFAKEARKCRARSSRASTGMIVMLDADTRSILNRLQALDEALVSAGQSRLDPNRDPIARLIPRRNVETWILCLNPTGNPVDEETDYKLTKSGEDWSAFIPTAADALHQWMKMPNNLPSNLIYSLRHGIEELPRALVVHG